MSADRKKNLDPTTLYQAIVTHDSRFDGRIFVGVKTTGIYCRPVCRVKTPKRSSCTFFRSAAAAELEGYRPCLRCRPELAPGAAAVDAPRRLAHAAVRLIEEGALGEGSLDMLAAQLGVTGRHLRRVFAAELGVAPIDYAQTHRLLLAKRLLTETELPVTEAALVAGFHSLRRFNALFKERYGFPPTRLRQSHTRVPATGLGFALAYRPPYAWEEILAFLGGRVIAGVEQVEDGTYRRTVALPHAGKVLRGWLEVSHRPKTRTLALTLAPSLVPALPKVLSRVRALFDLACAPDEVAAGLGDLAAAAPGLRVPGAFDGFELAVRAVLGQQVTVTAARTLAGRVAASLGDELQTPFAGLTHTFPSAATVAGWTPARLGALGIIRTRVGAIRKIAVLTASGRLRLDPSAGIDETLTTLQDIAGIGPWTAHYIAMRALAWPDAFIEADYGVRKALGGIRPSEIRARAEAWRPWRAYAVMHLWHSLEET